MSETKHTPGELHVSAFEILSGGSTRMLMGDDNFSIAYVGERSETENVANAARIALTWNCHDELVAALRSSHKFLCELAPSNDPLIDAIEAVLAKATTP